MMVEEKEKIEPEKLIAPEFVLLFNYKKEVGVNIVGHYFGQGTESIPIYSIKDDLVGLESILTYNICDKYVFMSNNELTIILLNYIADYNHSKKIEKTKNKYS